MKKYLVESEFNREIESRPSRSNERSIILENKGGRPRIVQSPEEFDRCVDEYVNYCERKGFPLTWTGMALALGFSSRTSIDEYQNYRGFSDSVKRAKLLVEHAYEVRLMSNAPAGAIFALKNFGWSDKVEVNAKRTDLSGMTRAEVDTVLMNLLKRAETASKEAGM